MDDLKDMINEMDSSTLEKYLDHFRVEPRTKLALFDAAMRDIYVSEAIYHGRF